MYYVLVINLYSVYPSKKIILRIVIDTSPYLRKLLADYFWLVINSNRICKKKKKLQSGCRRRNQLLQVLSRPLITPPRPESAVRSLPLSREEPLQGLEEAFAPPRRPSRVSASTIRRVRILPWISKRAPPGRRRQRRWRSCPSARVPRRRW